MKNICIILFVFIIFNFAYSGFGAKHNDRNDINTANSYKNAVLPINSSEEFNKKVLTSNKIVIVEFYSDWCNACRKMAPILNEFALDNIDRVSVYKVNFDYMQELVRFYSIFGLPTIIIFINGKEVKRVLGFKDYNQLELLIDTVSKK